jgi:hypothetical protein
MLARRAKLKFKGLVLSTVLLSWLTGCSTVTILVPRMVPARKANLGRYRTVAVNEFLGHESGAQRAATELSDSVRQGLASYRGIQVLDRSRLNQVLGELQLSASELADPEQRQKLGRLLTAAVLVGGKITTYDYRENVQREEQTCSRTEGKSRVEYPCTHYSREGRGLIRANIEVLDVTTGTTVVSDHLEAERAHATSAIDHTPAPIDSEGLLRAAQQQIADEFIRDVIPHTVYVEVPFRKDGDLPALELGIQYD